MAQLRPQANKAAETQTSHPSLPPTRTEDHSERRLAPDVDGELLSRAGRRREPALALAVPRAALVDAEDNVVRVDLGPAAGAGEDACAGVEGVRSVGRVSGLLWQDCGFPVRAQRKRLGASRLVHPCGARTAVPDDGARAELLPAKGVIFRQDVVERRELCVCGQEDSTGARIRCSSALLPEQSCAADGTGNAQGAAGGGTVADRVAGPARACSRPPGRQPTRDCSPRDLDLANAKLLAERDLRFMAMTTSGRPFLELFAARLNWGGEGRRGAGGASEEG